VSPQIQRRTKASNLLEMQPRRPKSLLENLLSLRGSFKMMEANLTRINAMVIEKHLAGRLDVAGCRVEVRERIVVGRIVKCLFIDGES
jgi:hypothetical protein